MDRVWSGFAGERRRRWWVGGTNALRRQSAWLGAAWVDGFYLNVWPRAAVALPAVSLLAGLALGALHPSLMVLQPPAVSFAQSLPLLVLAVLLGGFGAQFGLLLAAGYAAADLLSIFPLDHRFLSWTGFVLRIDGPRLVGDAALFVLAVVPALGGRALAASVAPALRRCGVAASPLAVLLGGALPATLVWGWAHGVPMVMRLPWLWLDQRPGIAFFEFWAFAAPLPAVAATAALGRAGLEHLAARRALAPEAGQILAALAAADLNPGILRRLPAAVGAAAAGLLTTGFVLGLVVTWSRAGWTVTLVVALYLARAYFWRLLPLLAGRVAGVPLLLRWLAATGAAVLLAGGAMALPWSDVRRNESWGSFGAELATIGLSLAVSLLLFPPARTSYIRTLEKETRP